VRVLIVQLASLGDVVHAMPVVHDIRHAFPDAVIDWVVEPAFVPLLRRVEGVHEVVGCAMRRWRRAWWTGAVRAEWRALKARLQREPYDVVVDLQGLIGSALVARLARGLRFGPGNATEGTPWEAPAAWLADHAVRIEPRIHAVDRARALVAHMLGRPAEGAPRYGLRVNEPERAAPRATVAFVNGGSRDDQLWPQTNWVQLGKRVIGAGWNIGLPQGSEPEQTRAELIAAGLQYEGQMRIEVWPNLPIDKVLDRLAGTHGVIGVDGGLSHLAVALDLPHVQIHNHANAWRTGPLPSHGRRFQVAVEARPAPGLEAVWSAWNGVLQAASA
jgi:heptosyltransferase I